GCFVALLAVAGAALYLAAESGRVVPLLLALPIVLLPVAWVVVFFGDLLHTSRREEGTAWVVGANGLAYCDDTRAIAILWDEIGPIWRAVFFEKGVPGVLPEVPLVFVAGDGRELTVTCDYRGVEQLLDRVRAELTRRLGPDARMLRVRQ